MVDVNRCDTPVAIRHGVWYTEKQKRGEQMGGKALPIQELYCSQADYSQVCRVTVEAIDAPTTPLIHQMSRFWLFTGGHGTITLQDRQYEVGPGTMVSVLPWQISDVVQVTEPLQYYLLTYYFDNINMAVKALGQADHTPLHLMEDMAAAPVVQCSSQEAQALRLLFEQLRQETARPDGDALQELYTANKLAEVVITFLRLGRHRGQPAQKATEKSDILHYMYTHLSEKLTLSQLSRQFFLSESAISAYITQTTGLSFFDLLGEMRIGRSISFLLYTDLTMEQLAEILGFVDSSHISKVFSARLGMKASEFREVYRRVGGLCGIRDDPTAYEVVSYLYHNYARDLLPQRTAERFGLSVRELNTLLLYQVEKDFSDFLNFLRINRACTLLKTTSRSVTDIAFEVGYNTVKTFNRNFLKFRGMSPSAFRQEIALQENTL